MARTKRDRAAKKHAQTALSGGGEAQPAHRRGQARAEAPQDEENGAPRVDNMNVTMAQLLAQLNKNPRIAAALADTGAHNHPALGPLAGLLAPPAAPVAAHEPESDDDEAETRDQTLLASLAACRKNEAKKEMLMLIKDEIKHGLWRRIKIIKNIDVRRQAALILLEILDFKTMQGDSVQAVQAQDDWLAIYKKHICRLLNELRGTLSSASRLLWRPDIVSMATPCPAWTCFWPSSGVTFPFRKGKPRPLPRTIMKPSSGGSPKFCPLLPAIRLTGKRNIMGS